jgi:hypothetical protein
MGWTFENVGDFSSREAAEQWARRNNINISDMSIHPNGDRGVSLSVRRSTLNGDSEQDRSFGRRDGF